MVFTEAEQGALVPQQLTPHNKYHSHEGLQPPKKELTLLPKVQELVQHSSSSGSSKDSPTSQQTIVWTEKDPVSTVSYQAQANSRRPRHVPIVITPSIIESVLRNIPDSSGLPERQRRPSSKDTVTEPNQAFRRLQRPRHIPIVIPAFAQPHCLLPPTPSSSGCDTLQFFPETPKGSECGKVRLLPPIERGLTPPPNMSRPTTSTSRTSTLDSSVSPPSPAQMYAGNVNSSSDTSTADMTSSQLNMNHEAVREPASQNEQSSMSSKFGESISFASVSASASGQQSQSLSGATNLSDMVCNVHKCTGKEPHALVGATTTILGDKLYVFGGRKLSRRRNQLTADLYELDLIRRHWTKIETLGNKPPPRYFHSVCALGDNKLLCYGGMSPAHSQGVHTSGNSAQQPPTSMDQQPEVVVMSDIHMYDTLTRVWTYIPATDNPQGRYAHCATVLPSSAIFTSANAPLSAIHHNPSSINPNQGTIGVALDGSGGAEMVVVGGQDSANHYIEQISVFNLRSLRWTATHSLGRSCGAYRSVVAPLIGLPADRIGKGIDKDDSLGETRRNKDAADRSSSMLIYSNYNFLDVKLELQVRMPDGSLTEKPMHGHFSPPGLRFPNGGVLDNHFVVSGVYLTSTKQEYALWALDLRTLMWSRIDAGLSTFSQGSWNRGILWPRRNTFVILGSRKRSLVDDYSHRRINFSNVCMVELESFGLYDNPRRVAPTSAYLSISAPRLPRSLSSKTSMRTAGGRPYFSAAKELGQRVMGLRELADMDLITITGERIPVNSQLLARRWGPYFNHLLREGASSSFPTSSNGDSGSSEVATLRPPNQGTSRNSSITITPSIGNSYSTMSTLMAPGSSSASSTINSVPYYTPSSSNQNETTTYSPPTPSTVSPSSRSRVLFLPHTSLTLHALLHYLYTSSLPPPTHSLSTPQILCSLLQLARPYRVDGLLEAVVERLHEVMDERNAPAVFNASAMAAGGSRGTGSDRLGESILDEGDEETMNNGIEVNRDTPGDDSLGRDATRATLRIDTSFTTHRNAASRTKNNSREPDASRIQDSEDDGSSASEAASTVSASSVTDGSEYLGTDVEEIWSGELSCVVGLQKRGLRGLMEGRRMRERGKSLRQGEKAGGEGKVRVGLGII